MFLFGGGVVRGNAIFLGKGTGRDTLVVKRMTSLRSLRLSSMNEFLSRKEKVNLMILKMMIFLLFESYSTEANKHRLTTIHP